MIRFSIFIFKILTETFMCSLFTVMLIWSREFHKFQPIINVTVVLVLRVRPAIRVFYLFSRTFHAIVI